MPSFGDMLEVVDLLRLNAISTEESHCVAVRNRNSSCRKCADACIENAITVSRNELSIAPEACVNCGCCIAVCPTNALHAVEPSQASLEGSACKVGSPESGMTVIACARKASKREGDPEKFAEVPCLGHVSEDELLAIAASGYDDIVLVDGDCSTCKLGAASTHIDDVVDTAAKLFDACNAEAIVTRSSEFPPEVIDRQAANARGKDRRGLMRQTGSYVKTVASNVAQKTIDERLGNGAEPVTMRDRLGMGKSGKVPAFPPAQNHRLLENMEKLSEGSEIGLREASETMRLSGYGDPCSDSPGSHETSTGRFGSCGTARGPHIPCAASSTVPYDSSGILNTRHFGNVYVDCEKCSGCGMCVMFCPTEALRFAEYDEPDNPDNRYLEFHASDCTQCMLCKDVCLRYCLEVDSKVSVEELFDFEPRLIEIPKPKTSSGLAGLRKKSQ